jgi:hypothetical protein
MCSTRARSFAPGAYDPAHPLTIDPSILYSTFAGTQFGWHYGVAADSAGAAYLAGRNTSVTNQTGAFVTKLSPSGNAVLYTTFLDNFEPRGIAVNAAGAVYVTNLARSSVPVRNAFQSTLRGNSDMYLGKLIHWVVRLSRPAVASPR